MDQSLSYKLGPWAPDLPSLVNPAFPPQLESYFKGGEIGLSIAQNCIWTATGYRAFAPLATTAALPAQCLGAITCYDTNGVVQTFAGTANALYKLESGIWTVVSRNTPAWAASTAYTAGQLIVDSNGNLQKCTTAGTSGTSNPVWNQTVGGITSDLSPLVWTLLNLGAYQNTTLWSFQQFGNCLDASNGIDVMQTINVTVGTNFAALDITSGDLVPIPKVLGVIRDFLVAGNTTDSVNGINPYNIQWSAISNDGSWPYPDTQPAFAAQAGSQTFYPEYGPIQAIVDNEYFGLIFQQTGINRAEYIGGAAVFSFYTYEKKRGLVNSNAVVRVGNKYYFLSPDGFFMTDGTTVTPIGYGLIDNWFFANAKTLTNVCAGADTRNKLIYFAFQSNAGTSLDSIMIFNYLENQWTYCQQTTEFLYPAINGTEWSPAAFDISHKQGYFTGTPGTATMTTREFGINPGGRALVNMVRPLTDGNTPSVSVGYRPTLSSTITYTSNTQASARTGVAGLRAEGLFHRLSIQPSGNFQNCVGASLWFNNTGAL